MNQAGTGTIRVVLADDHELVRSAIKALLLETVDCIDVVGEARDGAALLALLGQLEADVVMTDLAMPGMDGIDLLRRLKESFPQLRVVVLSMDDEPLSARRAYAAGAAGYMVKRSAPVELGQALQTVMAGRQYLSPLMARAMLDDAADEPARRLTERQRQVLRGIAQGLSAGEIGARLGLSAKTVDAHRSRIRERLNIRDTAGLTRYAVRYGLVS
jgi:DNA-binding NarL/FixJ family response regulator